MNLDFFFFFVPKERKYSKNDGGMLKKKYKCELHGAFNSQTWNNLSTKIEIKLTDYNALNTIHVRECIQI